jgi:hypothetical protein
MKWQEVRDHYSKQWLLVEAITAHSECRGNGIRHGLSMQGWCCGGFGQDVVIQ